jgi:hypothetical protein
MSVTTFSTTSRGRGRRLGRRDGPAQPLATPGRRARPGSARQRERAAERARSFRGPRRSYGVHVNGGHRGGRESQRVPPGLMDRRWAGRSGGVRPDTGVVRSPRGRTVGVGLCERGWRRSHGLRGKSGERTLRRWPYRLARVDLWAQCVRAPSTGRKARCRAKLRRPRAEGVGFEPTVRVNGLRFSRPVR